MLKRLQAAHRQFFVIDVTIKYHLALLIIYHNYYALNIFLVLSKFKEKLNFVRQSLGSFSTEEENSVKFLNILMLNLSF
jgi:hypothetical protein